MLYVIGAGIGLLLVIGVVSAVVSALHALVRPPEGASYSANQLFLLLVVGFVSAFAAPRVFSIHGDGWWLLPVGVFAATAKEAEAAVRKLEAAVRERIQMIEGCARKAEEVDETLRAERRRAAVAEQRDALRGRLGAMLSGVELTPDSPPSDSVDAVNTRAEAFRELKDSIEPRNLGLDGGPNDSADDSSWTSALSRLWPW